MLSWPNVQLCISAKQTNANFRVFVLHVCVLKGSSFARGRSVDMKGTFEAKGVANAKSRLQFVAAEVRKMHAYLWVYVRSIVFEDSRDATTRGAVSTPRCMCVLLRLRISAL